MKRFLLLLALLAMSAHIVADPTPYMLYSRNFGDPVKNPKAYYEWLIENGYDESDWKKFVDEYLRPEQQQSSSQSSSSVNFMVGVPFWIGGYPYYSNGWGGNNNWNRNSNRNRNDNGRHDDKHGGDRGRGGDAHRAGEGRSMEGSHFGGERGGGFRGGGFHGGRR